MYRITGNYADGEPVRYESLVSQATHMGAWLLPRGIAMMEQLYPSEYSLGEEYAFCSGLIKMRTPVVFHSSISYVVRVHASQTRLSATRSMERYRDQLRLIQESVANLIDSEVQLTADGRRSIAENCWAKGRHAIRIGLHDIGRAYIDYALLVDPALKPIGSMPYRKLTQMMGPVRAEHILEFLKRRFER